MLNLNLNFHGLIILIGERILSFNNLHHVILLILNQLIKMDTFFDLFNKTDLENINKILITEHEKDKPKHLEKTCNFKKNKCFMKRIPSRIWPLLHLMYMAMQ